jgi:hypothetical protein
MNGVGFTKSRVSFSFFLLAQIEFEDEVVKR